MPKKRKSRLSVNPWRKVKLLRRLETPEKRADRLERGRKYIAYRRAHETILEREERLARNRETVRVKRENAKKAQLKMLKERPCKCTCKEKDAQQTIVMLRKVNSVNYKSMQTRDVQRRRATEKNNERRRYKKTTSVFSGGDCDVQNYPLETMSDNHHLAYEAFLSRSIFQSQMHEMLMSMCPKTPEQMLQLGLIACPPEPFWRSCDERTLVDGDENDCGSTVGVECEVTIDEDEDLKDKKLFAKEKLVGMFETVICSPALEDEELQEKKLFAEENPLEMFETAICSPAVEDEELQEKKLYAEENPLEMFETAICSPAVVTQNCSGGKSITDVKNSEKEIPQSSNCQRSTESSTDVEIPAETPASLNCQ